MDGIGVNANTRSWDGEELKPALDLLLDSMHAGIWRVIVETVEKWEDVNDNDDPFNFNWDYYNKLYETPKFQKAFDMIAYLNAHGITNNLMLNFMGPVPGWIGKNDQPRKRRRIRGNARFLFILCKKYEASSVWACVANE